jgi:alpha-L-fucosidase
MHETVASNVDADALQRAQFQRTGARHAVRIQVHHDPFGLALFRIRLGERETHDALRN